MHANLPERVAWRIAHRPVVSFLAHLLIHSALDLSCNCWWSVVTLVVSVAGSSSVAPFAISSALSFPSTPMYGINCISQEQPTVLQRSPFCSRRGRSLPFNSMKHTSSIFFGSVLVALSSSHQLRICCQRMTQEVDVDLAFKWPPDFDPSINLV